MTMMVRLKAFGLCWNSIAKYQQCKKDKEIITVASLPSCLSTIAFAHVFYLLLQQEDKARDDSHHLPQDSRSSPFRVLIISI